MNISSTRLPILMIRMSLGLIYVWFGMLKFFPGLSPAELLAKKTIDVITFHTISLSLAYHALASWEVLLGLCFIFRFCSKPVLVLFFLHLVGTFMPLLVLRSTSFQAYPYGFTLVGQYIMKNLVFLGAGWLIWNTESGLRNQPKIA